MRVPASKATFPSLALLCTLQACAPQVATTEFCLEGEFDLGARYQGMNPAPGERYPSTWCVITDDATSRVVFRAEGHSNPDLSDSWEVAFMPPDLVRIVNRDAPPDVEFQGTDNLDEAMRVRRLDPRRLLEEYRAAGRNPDGLTLEVDGDRLTKVSAEAEFPLRGRVPVTWRYTYDTPERPGVELQIDDTVVFEATGHWRPVPAGEAAALWQPTGGAGPVVVPGDRWPARIDMKTVRLADGVYLVRGVRTGFQHLVVDTPDGLVVGDAPTGWLEVHQLPPADLVPGLGALGLSQKLIDFLAAGFPGRPLHAVALTHFHDDHAGGAPAFAARGAAVYAPAGVAAFLSEAFGEATDVQPVGDVVELGSAPNRVRLVNMGSGPHVSSMLGVWAVDAGYFFVSDVHVPRSESDQPRPGRARTELWFADWAVKNLPADVTIVNSHSEIETPMARLRRYLE